MGQTMSASVTRRKEQMVPRGDHSVTLHTPSTEHFIRFVADNTVRPEPWATEESDVVTDANYSLTYFIEGSLTTTLEDIPDKVMAGSLILRASSVHKRHSRKRAISVSRRQLITRKVLKVKTTALRLIAQAVEGSSYERKLLRMVRRIAVRETFKSLEAVFLPTTLGLKRQQFNVPFGLRGKPTTRSSSSRRSAAIVSTPTTTYVDPQPSYGEEAGDEARRD